MKRALFVIILLIFFLGGCRNNLGNDRQKENDTMHDVDITEIEMCGMEWDQIQFTVDLKGIDVLEKEEKIETNQDAKEIAVTIIEELHENGRFTNHIPASIIYSKKDNIWCFEYAIDQQNTKIEDLVDCGSLYVAMNGNGKLFKAWIEE